MSIALDEQIKQLKQTIAELEAQKSILSDDAVNASLALIRQKLAELEKETKLLKEESIELLHKAGEELRLSLVCYADNDLIGAAEHMVKMSSYWSPATLNEFLVDALGI